MSHINDNYGHAVGDKVIIEIANSLKNAFRKEDIVMRLGGDEFAAFAIGITDKNRGLEIIDRFLYNLRKVDIFLMKSISRQIKVHMMRVRRKVVRM